LTEKNYARIWLEFPMRGLSPNARLHWARKKDYINVARSIGKNQARKYAPDFDSGEPLQLTWIFFPPDRRVRDEDNIVASMKAYRDGVFDLYEVDDRQVVRSVVEFGEPVSGGRVLMIIEEIPNYKPRVCDDECAGADI
jgi:crossover junction endodeoxyribonuclease RusA